MIIDNNGQTAHAPGKHHAAKPRRSEENIPGAIAQAGNVILTEPASLRNSPESILDFLDKELGRQRWEIQQIIYALSRVDPGYVCQDQRCRTLNHGRMFPHIRSVDCQTESRG